MLIESLTRSANTVRRKKVEDNFSDFDFSMLLRFQILNSLSIEIVLKGH